MKKIYISGPMAGIARHNLPAFMEAESEWAREGYDVFNPAANAIGRGWTNVFGDATGTFNLRQAVSDDTEALTECDAVYMLEGWESSVGARAEHAVAVWLKLQIYYQSK